MHMSAILLYMWAPVFVCVCVWVAAAILLDAAIAAAAACLTPVSPSGASFFGAAAASSARLVILSARLQLHNELPGQGLLTHNWNTCA